MIDNLPLKVGVKHIYIVAFSLELESFLRQSFSARPLTKVLQGYFITNMMCVCVLDCVRKKSKGHQISLENTNTSNLYSTFSKTLYNTYIKEQNNIQTK